MDCTLELKISRNYLYLFAVAVVFLTSSILLFIFHPSMKRDELEEDGDKSSTSSSHNLNSFRSYNFTMTILMLSGLIYVYFSNHKCNHPTQIQKNINLFFAFWCLSSFSASVNYLCTVNGGWSISFLIINLFVAAGALWMYMEQKWKMPFESTILRPDTLLKALHGFLFSNPPRPDKLFKFLYGFLFVSLVLFDISINRYAWRYGYGRPDDSIYPNLGTVNMVIQIILSIAYFLLAFYANYNSILSYCTIDKCKAEKITNNRPPCDFTTKNRPPCKYSMK